MVFGICFKIFSLVIIVHCRRHVLQLRSSWVRAVYTGISYVRLTQHRTRHPNPMYLLTSIHFPIQREQWRWRSQVFQCASIFYRFIVGWRQLGLLCQDVSLLCTLSFHTSYFIIPLHVYQRFTLVFSVLIINTLVRNFTFNLQGLSIGLSIWRRRRWNNRGRSCWLNDICTQLITLLSVLAFYICLDCVRNDCTFAFTGFLNLFRFWIFFNQLTWARVILRSFHFGLSRRRHYWKRVINLSFFFPGFTFRCWRH